MPLHCHLSCPRCGRALGGVRLGLIQEEEFFLKKLLIFFISLKELPKKTLKKFYSTSAAQRLKIE
jgi:hypothetical protein